MIPDQSASQRWFSEAPGLSLEALQDESDVKVANWKCHETQLILFSALKTNNEPWERNRNRKKQCVKQRTRVEGFSSTNGVREGSIEELTTWCLEGRPALKWPPTAFSLNFMPLQLFVQKALLEFGEENVTNSDEIQFDQNVAAFYNLSYFHNRKHVDTSVFVWRAWKNVSFQVMPMLQCFNDNFSPFFCRDNSRVCAASR